jgi:serine/threonine-protein kinase RsbW
MTGNGKDTTGERLNLGSRLSELAVIPPWIERLAERHAISANTQFAMDLCLEEVLSNIIRHGYSNKPDFPIVVQFTGPAEDYYKFIVEDEAPPFNPVIAPVLPAAGSPDEVQIGGNGIRLLRRFADTLEYQAMPTGNRLTIGFSVAGSALAKE